jgi:cell division protein FtsL
MIDWVGGIEVRNYGIKRVIGLRHLSVLLRMILPVAILMAFLCFYLWSCSQVVHLGYEDQQLQTLADSLRRTQKDLILEEETLKDPQRIDGIARNQLNMGPLHANQIVAPQDPAMGLNGPSVLALADPPASSSGSNALSAAN